MSLRTSDALALTSAILLAACSGGKEGQVTDASPLDCRLPGKTTFERLCQVDRMVTPDGTVLTVRKPDGGFQRLLIVKDGRGVIAADGAVPVKVRPVGGEAIDVTTSDGTTWQLPARVTK
ncbi:hypothetical protein [Sphingomonas montanisoli]|uniref:Lipoprotein n=1 Tax=Sphingomonas montanisoli TaxID=2606412 RepID=A0A5D9C9H7_9SPHN|nr:hypothetical protein [Sphingomonas montanisoli]TZG28056.1 hypothetical protein FYJ91_11055 [Sphingomonas montanisoli]